MFCPYWWLKDMGGALWVTYAHRLEEQVYIHTCSTEIYACPIFTAAQNMVGTGASDSSISLFTLC